MGRGRVGVLVGRGGGRGKNGGNYAAKKEVNMDVYVRGSVLHPKRVGLR